VRRLQWSALGTRCEVQYVCPDDSAARTFDQESAGWLAGLEKMGAEAVVVTDQARHQTKGFHRYEVTQ